MVMQRSLFLISKSESLCNNVFVHLFDAFVSPVILLRQLRCLVALLASGQHECVCNREREIDR